MSDGNDTTQIKNIKWSIGGKQVPYNFDPKWILIQNVCTLIQSEF